MFKDSLDISTSLTSVLDTVDGIDNQFVGAASKLALSDGVLGNEKLPLCRVTGTDNRVNSAEVLKGSR